MLSAGVSKKQRTGRFKYPDCMVPFIYGAGGAMVVQCGGKEAMGRVAAVVELRWHHSSPHPKPIPGGLSAVLGLHPVSGRRTHHLR